MDAPARTVVLACFVLAVSEAAPAQVPGGPPIAATPLTTLPSTAAPDDPGVVVTTDTKAWCNHLAIRFDALETAAPEPHAEAHDLALRGSKLCAQGRVREGLWWLRRAITQLPLRQGP